MNELKELQGSIKRFVPGLILLILLLGVVFIAMDWNQIQSALAQASLSPIPYTLGTTLISYFCISYSFANVSKLLGIKMRMRELTVVGFVSTVLNHVVSSGGAAGYSVRYALMNRYSVSMREVLTVSFLHFYLTSVVMIAMLPVGLLFLGTHAAIGSGTAALLAGLAVVVILGASLATGLVFWSSLRGRLMRVIERVTRALLHREVGATLVRFEATLAEGLTAIRRHPGTMIGIMLLIITDWIASAITLWFCFRALGVAITPGELITGFVIGIMAGVASMIPGGLGVQEGSMAGVFALMGVSFDRAVLASILFRATYFIIPYLISLGFYWRLLRKHNGDIEVLEWEGEHAHPDA